MDESRALRPAVATAVFVAAFAVYVATLAPTTGFVDSGFLTVAAWSLGNAHPPGFPLYLLVTHLFTMLPFGTVAVRANLASAFFAAGACAFVALAVGEAVSAITFAPPRAPASGGKKKKGSPAAAEARGYPQLAILVAMAASGLLLAVSRTLWSWATIAEVYALNTFLIALLAWLSLVWRRSQEPRLLYLIAAVAGLSLGVHHLTVFFALLGIGALMLVSAGAALVRSRPFAIALGIGACALLAIYSYLPLAASDGKPINWGDPSSLSRVVDHISAKQYRSYVSTTDRGSQADDIVRIVGRDFGAFGLPLAVAAFGVLVLFRRDRALFAALAVTSIAACAWMLVYPIVNDEDAYLLPLFVSIAIAAGVGAASLVRKNAAFAVLLALPLIAAVSQWDERDRSGFIVPRLYAENALRGIAQDGLLITNDQDLYGALLYYQTAEKLRSDVTVIHHSLLTRSWYLDTIERRHRELVRAKAELEAVRRPLALIEAGGSQGEDPATRNEFYARLDELVLALVREQVAAGGRAYATHDVAFSKDPVAAALVRRLAMTYEAVPRALAVELIAGRSQPVSLLPVDLRGLTDGSSRYADGDVVTTTIIPAYRDALVFRARYLAAQRRIGDAAREYRAALSLVPADQAIERELQLLGAR